MGVVWEVVGGAQRYPPNVSARVTLCVPPVQS